MSDIQLGDRVKDKITGITGIVVSRTEWLNNCVRLGVQPESFKDGKRADVEHMDESDLVVVKATVHKRGWFPPEKVKRFTGGPPRPEPRARNVNR